jgi:hypothetical protein
MRRGYLAAVLVVLAAASSAWADEEPQGSMRTWVDADYLLWWFKPAPAGPALLTTGSLTTPTAAGSGILGQSGTSLLAGNSYLNQGPYSGFKIGGGFMDCSGTIGGEGSFFYLAQRGIDETFTSGGGGSPLLARPIVDARTGNETVLFVAAPNAFSGSFNVHSSTGFLGADGNVLFPFVRCNACYPDEIGKYVTGLAGFLYLNLRDDETLSQSSNVLPLGVGFFNNLPVPAGGNIAISDDIRTLNQFYGGQIGLKAGISWWRFTLNGVGKVALGSMRESANLSGNTSVSSLGLTSTTPSGLYVLNTNAGSYSRNIIAVVPQGTLTVAVEITAQLKLTLGYTIIYMSDVARPGDLIDRTVNRTELPSSQTFNPIVGGPQRPGFSWSGTDFWAQGINVGLSLRF